MSESGLPPGLLAWVEKPLSRALEALERVPMRVDEHRAWIAVWADVRNAREACRELRKLARWINEKETQPHAAKPPPPRQLQRHRKPRR